jgi:hypothetical protein
MGRRSAEEEMAGRYLILANSVKGEHALWWRPNKTGYTVELSKAGVYTRAELIGLRETDIPVPFSLAKDLAVCVVFVGTLRESLIPKEPT